MNADDVVPVRRPIDRGKPTIQRKYAEKAYEQYVRRYNSYDQSFDRLHERGGFGLEEIIDLFYERIVQLEAKERRE